MRASWKTLREVSRKAFTRRLGSPGIPGGDIRRNLWPNLWQCFKLGLRGANEPRCNVLLAKHSLSVP